MSNIKNNKKAYYFSLDALIAILLLLGILMFIHPVSKVSPPEMKLQDDAIQVLSAISVQDYAGEARSALDDLITAKKITDTNQSLLEALVELYSSDNKNDARDLSDALFLNDFEYPKMSLVLGGEQISSHSPPPSSIYIWNAKESVSGIATPETSEGNLTGYSASASLRSKFDSEYFYFGGYVGQGNITARMHYEGAINTTYVEGVFSEPFKVFVNSEEVSELGAAGVISPSPDKSTPIHFEIPASYFSSADNNYYIKFSPSPYSKSFYISGGYIRISYKSTNNYETKKRFYFSGIEGIINLYDSLYIPSNSTSSANLHLVYTNNYSSFFTIGNTSINITESAAETTEDINLADYLSLSSLGEKTIPIRYGLENFSLFAAADVAASLVIDVSGSMGACTGNTHGTAVNKTWTTDGISYCGIRYNDVACTPVKRKAAIIAENKFADIFLKNSGSLMSIVDYTADSSTMTVYNHSILSGTRCVDDGTGQKRNTTLFPVPEVSIARKLPLTDNKTQVGEFINSTSSWYGTCICCGILSATNILNTSNKARAMVVMSDGFTNVRCNNARSNLNGDKRNGRDIIDENDDAIQAACDAYNLYNITVYSIAFGANSDFNLMKNISACGHGKYSYADSTTIADIFANLSQAILNATYSNQTISSSVSTILSPDSYIEVSYSSQSIPFGEVITTETQTFDNSLTLGNLFLPEAEEYLDAKVISYSGDLWTDKVYFKNQTDTELGKPWRKLFDLGDYNTPYFSLGDPYMISIPKSFLVNGTNTINISAAKSDLSYRIGSPSDKAIYTFRRNFISPSPIKEKAVGCIWSITFFDNSVSEIPIFKEGVSPAGGICNYSNLNNYDPDDAIQYATKQLLDSLNFDKDVQHKVDVKFESQDLQISNIVWANIPFSRSTEVRVSTWR